MSRKLKEPTEEQLFNHPYYYANREKLLLKAKRNRVLNREIKSKPYTQKDEDLKLRKQKEDIESIVATHRNKPASKS
jgi:hypothetical protein